MSASDSEGEVGVTEDFSTLNNKSNASFCQQISELECQGHKKSNAESEAKNNNDGNVSDTFSLTDTDGELCGSSKLSQAFDNDVILEDSLEKEKGRFLEENNVFTEGIITEDNVGALCSQPYSDSVGDTNSQSSMNIESPLSFNSSILNGVTNSILYHPAYKTLIQDVSNFKDQVKLLQKEITRLECENQRLEADRSHEIYAVQLETLEKTIAQQQNEIQKLTIDNKLQTEMATKSFNHMRDDLEGKLQKLSMQYEVANTEREAMVMRYVNSEKEVIDLQKGKENLEKKLKEFIKERDILNGKLKTASTEKVRICQMLDNKTHELATVQKENERLKEDLNSREIKIKWLQNKLKVEMDVHKDTQNRVDKLVQRLQECKEETELVKQDCQETMRAFQESEDNKAYTLGVELKELQARLIMERHEREGKEETYKQLQLDVDNLKKKNQVIIEENNDLSVKVQNLEKERLEYEQNVSKYKRTSDKQRQDIVDLQNKIAEMEALKMQLQHGQEKVAASQAEVERLRESNEELLQDMSQCREREAELLDFTQKLTEKNVRLQSEFSAIEAKAQQLEYEQGPLQRQLAELQEEVETLQKELQQEKQQRLEESTLLARHLAERTRHSEDLARQVEDLQGEIQVVRRKNQTTIKELTRELQHYRKKEAANEISSSSNSLGQTSRASSSSSLNTLGDGNSNHSNGASKPKETTPLDTNSNQGINSLEPDRQMLIERIVKLQRAIARKQEKIEFLEEHSKQLVTELQKKTRIIQNYIMREQVGALSSEMMDHNKAEVMKHGGIMASLYGSKVTDNTITLELSLEINKKLQAVLEDTLLKNITLKENIDTLGSEIARLTVQKGKQEVHR